MKMNLFQSKRFVLTLTLTMCCVAFSVLILGLAIALNKAPNKANTSAQYIYGNNSIVKLEVIDDITLEDDTIEKLQPKIKVTSTGKQGEFGALVTVTPKSVIFDYTLDNTKHSFATMGKDITIDDGNDIGGGGSYTAIYNVNQLKAFRNAVNRGKDYAGETIKLTADIDLTGNEWDPIGKSYGSTSAKFTYFFKGEFDGQGHTISNFKITNPADNYYRYDAGSTRHAYGFFAFVDCATILNLRLDNVTISIGSSNKESGHFLGVGALVGYSEGDLTIDNCTVDNAKINITYGKANEILTGGMVGWINGNYTTRTDVTQVDNEKWPTAQFSYCSVTNSSIVSVGKSTSIRYFGGLYGQISDNGNNKVKIDNCLISATLQHGTEVSKGYCYGVGPASYAGATVTQTYERCTFGSNSTNYHFLGGKILNAITYEKCYYHDGRRNVQMTDNKY